MGRPTSHPSLTVIQLYHCIEFNNTIISGAYLKDVWLVSRVF
jgi:hypothetical protein